MHIGSTERIRRGSLSWQRRTYVCRTRLRGKYATRILAVHPLHVPQPIERGHVFIHTATVSDQNIPQSLSRELLQQTHDFELHRRPRTRVARGAKAHA